MPNNKNIAQVLGGIPKIRIANTLTMSSCDFHVCHDQTALVAILCMNQTARRGAPTKMIPVTAQALPVGKHNETTHP